VKPVRALLENLEPAKLAEYLIGGILKADLHPMTARSLSWEHLRADDFVLPPLPNTLFSATTRAGSTGGHYQPHGDGETRPPTARSITAHPCGLPLPPIFKDEKSTSSSDE